MNKKDIETIKQNRNRLIGCIELIEILRYLPNSHIFLEEDLQKFEDATLTEEDRLLNLLESLPNRGPKAFRGFVDVLMQAQQLKAAWILDPQISPDAQRYGYGDQHQFAGLDEDQQDSCTVPAVPGIVVKKSAQLYGGTIFDSDKVYKMESKPRGLALIINNIEFPKQGSRRDGAEKDDPALKALLEGLGFTVAVDEKNKTAEEMWNLIKDFANHPGHANADCSVVSIMTHGDEQGYCGVDFKKLTYLEIYSIFGHRSCPNLRGKPKIFLIQGCRGSGEQIGVPRKIGIDGGSASLTYQEGLEEDYKDMFAFFSTLDGLTSIRDHKAGCWFIKYLVEVFSENAHKDHFHDLCNEVNRRMGTETGTLEDPDTRELKKVKQSANYSTQGHVKTLYFNPGL